jgi:hypothetical protein
MDMKNHVVVQKVATGQECPGSQLHLCSVDEKSYASGCASLSNSNQATNIVSAPQK